MIVVADASAIVVDLLQTGRFSLLSGPLESGRDCTALRRALSARRLDEARAVEAP